MEENLVQADDPRIVDFDAGIAGPSRWRWGRAIVQERKVDVDIEPMRLEAGETVGDGLERLTDCIEMVVGGALAQDFLAHYRNAEHLPEEVHHLLGP
jgi:hypothetical protein